MQPDLLAAQPVPHRHQQHLRPERPERSRPGSPGRLPAVHPVPDQPARPRPGECRDQEQHRTDHTRPGSRPLAPGDHRRLHRHPLREPLRRHPNHLQAQPIPTLRSLRPPRKSDGFPLYFPIRRSQARSTGRTRHPANWNWLGRDRIQSTDQHLPETHGGDEDAA